MNTLNLPRAAVSILKVIDNVHLTDITVTVAPHSALATEQRIGEVQPGVQPDLIENRA
jgi:hypothetical protein